MKMCHDYYNTEILVFWDRILGLILLLLKLTYLEYFRPQLRVSFRVSLRQP